MMEFYRVGHALITTLLDSKVISRSQIRILSMHTIRLIKLSAHITLQVYQSQVVPWPNCSWHEKPMIYHFIPNRSMYERMLDLIIERIMLPTVTYCPVK